MSFFRLRVSINSAWSWLGLWASGLLHLQHWSSERRPLQWAGDSGEVGQPTTDAKPSGGSVRKIKRTAGAWAWTNFCAALPNWKKIPPLHSSQWGKYVVLLSFAEASSTPYTSSSAQSASTYFTTCYINQHLNRRTILQPWLPTCSVGNSCSLDLHTKSMSHPDMIRKW